jgi:peptidoglycan/LPS O-acetylase OafA/YrhL
MVLQHHGLNVARRMETIGHLGVLFFFVHTALVLLRSLERAEVRGLVLNFWIRRAFRIYPLCWVCLLGILIFKVPQFAGLTAKTWDWRVVLSNALLIQNLTHQPDMIDPLWSLPREVQMYAALPFIFLLLQRFSSTITVLVLWLVSIELIPAMPFFTYFPCFMGGVLAYQLSRERTVQMPGSVFAGGLIILIAAYTALCWSAASLFYDFDFVLCMALGALIPNVRDMRPSLVSRVSEIIARHSYGVYLWHVPVIWFSFVVLHRLPAAAEWMVFAGMMGALPAITYRMIEAPMIRAGQRLASLSAVPFDRLWPTDACLLVDSDPSAD